MWSIRNLTIDYKNNPVLDGFNLDLAEGEIFALLGASGSGKSSTLRFIAGLDEVQDGEILRDGVHLSKSGQHLVRAERRKIGMVFQDYALFPHLTVIKNIAFGIQHLTKSQRQSKVSQLLALIDLPGIEAKYPHQLSGGEQQRVALARALATMPKLLLLDEPFSNLDKNHHDLLTELREILKKSEVSAILVTHDEDEARLVADRLGIIDNKKLKEMR